MTNTEIVYILSADRSHQLQISLHSLIHSGTHYDSIRIIWVGTTPATCCYHKSNVIEEEVASVNPAFFMSNKVLISRSPAKRVVLLDSDTVVLAPLHPVWEGSTKDIIARPASRYLQDGFDPAGWQSLLETIGMQHFTPYFNSGFIVFNNGSHQKIRDLWLRYTDDLRLGKGLEVEQAHEKKNSNQVAFSLAVAKLGLSYQLMKASDHFYWWYDELSLLSDNKVLLFHTGNRHYWQLVCRLGKSEGFSSWPSGISRMSVLLAEMKRMVKCLILLNWKKIAWR